MRELAIIIFLCIIHKSSAQAVDSLKIKAENNQNPNKWNVELFKKELEWSKNNKSKPLKVLAFPVEKYDFYAFTNPFNFKIGQGNFSGISFGENVEGNQGKMKLRHDLTLVFYTKDTIMNIEGYVSSRNYPYLTVQGSLKLNEIYDYVGVKNPDENGFLMVSTKSFDLKYGQTIIIFPNNNNSFYYLQLEEKVALNENFDSFINRLKTNNKISSMIKFIDDEIKQEKK
jgi:hypothetical protein